MLAAVDVMERALPDEAEKVVGAVAVPVIESDWLSSVKVAEMIALLSLDRDTKLKEELTMKRLPPDTSMRDAGRVN